MSFWIKLAGFVAVFVVIFAVIGLIIDQPLARMATAGVLPGVGVGFGYLTVRERDKRIAERKAAERAKAAEQGEPAPE